MNKDERINLRNQLFNALLSNSIIIPFKQSYKISRKPKFLEYLNTHSNINDLYNTYVKEFTCEEEALYCLTHNSDYTEFICPVCNDKLRFGFFNRMWSYRKTCGKPECAQKLIHSEEASKKQKETFLKNYGVDNPAKSKEVLAKIRETNKTKYGKEYVVETEMFKKKSKETCLNKYNVENYTQTEECKERIKATNLERYGREAFLQGREIHDRIEETNMQKYGHKHAMQNKDIQAKARATNLERRGVEYPMQSEQVKENFRLAYCKNNYPNKINQEDVKLLLQKFNSSSVDELYANNQLLSESIKFLHSIKNRDLRLRELSEIFGVNTTTIKYRASALDLLQYFYIRDVNLEVQFKGLLDDNNIHYLRRDRSTIGPEEIDFLLDEYKIGIEINDLASHNIKCKSQDYHINKVLNAAAKGVRLIHIWEWELTNDALWSRLSNWILNICNTNKTRIFARNCDIRLVPLEEEKDFLDTYHLQGYIKSELCYGLYYNNELIQLMSFTKSRYNKNYEWELLRLCTKYGYTLVGGSNKLIQQFITTSNPKSIISYCDLSKFTGKVYEDMNFKLIKRNQPSATWYNEETEDYFLHSSLVKKGADKLLGTNFGKGTDNEAIAIQQGYVKVFNCGMSVYGLTLKSN